MQTRDTDSTTVQITECTGFKPQAVSPGVLVSILVLGKCQDYFSAQGQAILTAGSSVPPDILG